MLDELMRYTDENKTHFDIVAAMGMTELADEELGNVTPIKVVKEEVVTNKVGYYTDERGYKRWGVIPNTTQTVQVNSDFGERGPRSSDPRLWGME